MCPGRHPVLRPRSQQEPSSAASCVLLLQVGAGLSAMERQIRKSRASLEKDVKALSQLLARLGKGCPGAPLGSSCEL